MLIQNVYHVGIDVKGAKLSVTNIHTNTQLYILLNLVYVV